MRRRRREARKRSENGAERQNKVSAGWARTRVVGAFHRCRASATRAGRGGCTRCRCVPDDLRFTSSFLAFLALLRYLARMKRPVGDANRHATPP
jgi:hypothetical protein